MLRPYADVLRRPGALAFSMAGLLARMPISMEGLGIVLLISSQTGSYALAGALAATFQLAASLLSPIGARYVDRWGQFRVLPMLASVAGLSLLAFAWCAVHGYPTWQLFLTAGVSGAFQPNIGSLVRARWAAMLTGTPALRTAFALESVLDEVIFVIGPPLATMLATTVAPWSAVVLGAVLLLVGSALLTVQRSTQPTAARHDDLPPGRAAIRLPGLVLVTVVFVLLGGVFGSSEVTTVAFAQQRGMSVVAGALLALFSFGSLVGGLVFGTRSLRTPLPQQFWVAIALLALCLLPLPLIDSPVVLGLDLLVAGLMVAPSLIIGMTLVENLVPARQLTEAMTWSTTGIALGVALSASAAGALVDASGTSAAFAITAASALAATLVAFLTRRPLMRVWRAEIAPGAGPQASVGRD